MKKTYTSPDISTIELNSLDIIRTSGYDTKFFGYDDYAEDIF